MRLWRYSIVASICAGIIAFVALGLNLSNSLGAIAGRSDVVTTERIESNRKIRATEVELKRLTDLRDAIEAFVPTDAEAVGAAKRAADAAAKSREASAAPRRSNAAGIAGIARPTSGRLTTP